MNLRTTLLLGPLIFASILALTTDGEQCREEESILGFINRQCFTNTHPLLCKTMQCNFNSTTKIIYCQYGNQMVLNSKIEKK